MWWFWLLVSLAGYIPGFLISGIIFSYTFKTRFARDDYVWAMFVWPLFDPCYLVFKMTLKYIEFLENNRATRLRKITPVKQPAIRVADWEQHE